jgi:hypothetical protein
MAGPFEGILVGAVTGIAAAVAVRVSLRIGVAVAVVLGGATGALVSLLGGRLMGGSLASLADAFPDSRLRLDGIGGMFGEAAFGPISQTVTAGLETGLFASFVVAGMVLASRVIDGKVG